MIPVINGQLEPSQDHLGNTLATYQKSMISKKYKKKRNICIGHYTHTYSRKH
jgi:hypothetical protein